jgi:hypothetical protein
MKMIKVIILLLNVLIISCRSSQTNAYYENIEDKIMEENKNVKLVNILRDEGDWGEKKLWMLIVFQDEQWVVLKDFIPELSTFRVRGINNYEFFIYSKKADKEKFVFYRVGLYSTLVEDLLQIKITSINDLIINFERLSGYIPTFEDFPQNDSDDIWNTYSDKIIKINNIEYIFFKKPLWKYATSDLIFTRQNKRKDTIH